jgi:hypothetical protein
MTSAEELKGIVHKLTETGHACYTAESITKGEAYIGECLCCTNAILLEILKEIQKK